MGTRSYRPANEERDCQQLDGGRDGELKWTVEAGMTFEHAVLPLTEHVTPHSCHPAMHADCILLVLFTCITPSPLPLAAATLHSPLPPPPPPSPPPDMVATTPPHTETSEYTLWPLLKLAVEQTHTAFTLYSHSAIATPFSVKLKYTFYRIMWQGRKLSYCASYLSSLHAISSPALCGTSLWCCHIHHSSSTRHCWWICDRTAVCVTAHTTPPPPAFLSFGYRHYWSSQSPTGCKMAAFWHLSGCGLPTDGGH